MPHQFIVEDRLLCAFIHSTYLCLVPCVEQLHHIVVPTYVAFDDFTRTRVADMWSIGIAYVACEIAYYGVASIFEAHGRVVRPFLSTDSILESSLFKCRIPIVYASNEIRYPFLRCSRVNVIYYLLDRLHEFATAISLDILRLQSPSGDDLTALHLLLIVTEVGKFLCEIAYTRVVGTASHRLFRQKDEGSVDLQRDVSRDFACRDASACLRTVGLYGDNLCIDRERADALNVGEVLLESSHSEFRLAAFRKREDGIVGIKHICDVDAVELHSGGVCQRRVYFGGIDDRILGTVGYSSSNLVITLDAYVIEMSTQEHLLVVLFPVEHLLIGEFSAIYSSIYWC